MLYFSLYDILISYATFAWIGILFGILYSFIIFTLRGLSGIIRIPKEAYRLSLDLTRKRIHEMRLEFSEINKTLLTVVDFLYFLSYGATLIILNYVFLDGTQRALVPMVSAACLYLTVRYPMQRLEPYTMRIIELLYKTVSIIAGVMIIPVRKIIIFIYRVGYNIYSSIVTLPKIAYSYLCELKNKRKNREKDKKM